MANGTDTQGTFPGVDPQKLAMIRAMVQASQGDTSGIPAAPPDQPTGVPSAPSPIGPTSPFDVAGNLQRIGQIPEVAQPISQMQEAYKGLKDISATQERMGIPTAQGGLMPKMGWLDTQGQPQQPGFLNTLKRALIALAASTRPGQAIEGAVYGPGINRYEALKDTLAQRRQTLEQEAGIPKSQLAAESGLAGAVATGAYKGGQLENAAERNRIAQEKADTYRQSVQNHLQLGMKGLDIRAILAGSTVELNKAKVMLDNVLAQVLPQRVEVEQYGIDTNAAVRQAIMNAEVQMGMQKEHPLLNLFDSTFGTSLTPGAPQTPGGAQPVKGETPLPPRTPAKPNTPRKKEVVKF